MTEPESTGGLGDFEQDLENPFGEGGDFPTDLPGGGGGGGLLDDIGDMLGNGDLPDTDGVPGEDLTDIFGNSNDNDDSKDNENSEEDESPELEDELDGTPEYIDEGGSSETGLVDELDGTPEYIDEGY